MKKILCAMLVMMFVLSCVPAFAEGGRDLTKIRINEFMASNGKKILLDKKGESSDWIELYNDSDVEVDLQGLCLSDGKKQLEKFVFPQVIIPAHGFIIVFCSGEEDLSTDELHAAFKLNASEGEKVVISYEGVILDLYEYAAQTKNISMARDIEGNWQYTSTPTPGYENVITPVK